MQTDIQLQVALLRSVVVVIVQGALNIDRVRVEVFDQLAVIAVHGAHQIRQRCQGSRRQAAEKREGLLR